MDCGRNLLPEQKTKKFRSSKDGDQSQRGEGFARMTCKFLSQQSAHIDVFDSNPLEFYYFMSIFDKMVRSKVIDPISKLTQLIKDTKAEA